MGEKEILETIGEIVKSINEKAKITEKTALLGDSILDSLEFMNYLTKIEESYKMKIKDSEVAEKSLGVVENMVKYLSTKTQIK
jgi:acyl carrier protein